ncbi:hypothetical protein [Nitratifractor sp.]
MRIVWMVLLLLNLTWADSDYEEEEHKRVHIPYDMRHLDLSEGQSKEIYRLLVEYRKQRRKLHENYERLERRSVKLFVQDRFDKERYLQGQLRIKEKLLRIEADFLERLHRILDAKQRKKFIKDLKEWEFD